MKITLRLKTLQIIYLHLIDLSECFKVMTARTVEMVEKLWLFTRNQTADLGLHGASGRQQTHLPYMCLKPGHVRDFDISKLKVKSFVVYGELYKHWAFS